MEGLVKQDQSYGGEEVVLARDPEEVLKEAARAAEALKKVVAAKPQKVVINKEQYLEFEDWQLLGKFYGLTAKVERTSPVTFGNVRGWEAHAVVIDRRGLILSAGDAMCLNDEERWSTRPKYEDFYFLKDGTKTKEEPPRNQMVWIPNPNKPGKRMPKKERVKVGDEAVPFFQLRSMAQTRACAKALRNVLSWVVVLAGYKPLSAEELSGPAAAGEPDADQEPKGSEAGTGESSSSPGAEEPITEEQKAQILAELRKKNLPLETLEGYMDKTLEKFNRYPDPNQALEWIRKQKAG